MQVLGRLDRQWSSGSPVHSRIVEESTILQPHKGLGVETICPALARNVPMPKRHRDGPL